MTSQFNRFIPYEERKEYNPTPEDTAIECALLTDMSDDLMEVPSSIGTEHSDEASINGLHTSIYRTFRYMDSDCRGGWHWPLVEKEIILSYERHLDEEPTETYCIETNIHIHQVDIDVGTISTTYDISYSSLARDAVEATIRSVNLTAPGGEEYTSRPMTPYDAMQLGDEFSAFNVLLRSSKQDDLRVAQQEAI